MICTGSFVVSAFADSAFLDKSVDITKNNGFDWAIIVSIVGASAWIPHLVSLVYKFLSRPILVPIPSKVCEIGFTELGNILNFDIMFVAERDNILIDCIDIVVTHENGAQYNFVWHEYDEQYGVIVKSSEALALCVPMDFGRNVRLKNRIKSHFSEYLKLMNAFCEEKKRLIRAGNYNYQDLFVSQKAQDLISFFKSQFIFQKGTYSCALRISTKRHAVVRNIVAEFCVDENDILAMQENISNFDEYVKNMCIEKTQRELCKILQWNWISKEFKITN